MKKLLVSSFALLIGWSLSAAFMYESTMTVSGYAGSETLAGFPVLVRLAKNRPSGFDYSQCQADGKDIQFLSPDGETVYPHEVEKWDASGESLIWVRIPELSGTATQFLFRFGDASVTEAPSAKSTWVSSADGHYAAVWHFGDTVTTGSEVAKDSAQHDAAANLDLTPKGSTAYAQSTTGVVGSGRVNTTDADNAVRYETSLSGDFSALNLAPSFTVSGWFRVNHWRDEFTSGKRMRVIGRSTNGYSGDGAWVLDLNTGTSRTLIYGSGSAKNGCAIPALSDMKWEHLALVFTAEGVSCYANGALISTMSGVVADNNEKNLRLGYPNALVSDPTSYYGDYDEIRMLNVSASADWIKAEYDSAANPEFVTAEPVQSLVTDAFFVESSGERIGTVTPGYGQYAGALSDGTEIACSAEMALVDVSETLKSGLRGWKLYGQDKDDNTWTNISAGTENACTYVHVGGENRKLEWQVVNMRPVTLSANRSVTYTINGETAQTGVNWVREGEEVEIAVASTSGVEGEDYAFAGWTGDVGGSQGAGSQTLKLTVTGPIALTARYQNLHFVSAEKGSDETGDGSRDKPWATINFAIANAATYDGDEIRIAGGTYTEVVENKTRSCLTIRGGYAADWTRDISNCPTVIRQDPDVYWSSRKNVVSLGAGVVSNRLDGLTITGGADGIKVADYYGHRFDRLIVTNNVQGIEFAWCNAHTVAGGDTVIASSYISHNGHAGSLKYGTANYGISISDSAALVSTFHILNCTIVSNGTYGVITARHPLFVINSVIAGNGWDESRVRPADFMYGLQNNKVTRMRHTDVWNRDSRRSIVLAEDFCGATGVNLNRLALYAPKKLFNVDPRLAADGSLAADSPLVGLGEDLSAAAIPVTEDVHGNPFVPGAYDIGCFKASVTKAKPALAATVYVAADGDDANDGLAPERPLRSVGVALTRVAENGTVQVASGTYDEAVVLDVPGVTLQGAGMDETVFREESATNSFGLYVGAPEVTVKNLSVERAMLGVQISDQTTATNALVESCRLFDNGFGYFHCNEGKPVPGYPGLSVPVFRFSHLVVSNNACGAGYLGNMGAPAVMDTSLVAFNGGVFGPYGGPYSSATKDHYYNCTFVSNANYAVFSDSGGNSARDTKFYNCIMVGSPIGWKCNGHFGWGENCIFDCDENYSFRNTTSYWQSGKTNDLYEVTAPLQWTDRKWAHPIHDSLAAKGGKNFNGTDKTLCDVTTDLDEKPGSSRKWFIGCYAPDPLGLMLLVK